jgi:hypothetical protein
MTYTEKYENKNSVADLMHAILYIKLYAHIFTRV